MILDVAHLEQRVVVVRNGKVDIASGPVFDIESRNSSGRGSATRQGCVGHREERLVGSDSRGPRVSGNAIESGETRCRTNTTSL